MGVDREEALLRHGGKRAFEKNATKHPYAAIHHRVIDSPAYADLTFAARSLLVLFARQLTKDNNGNLIAAKSYLQQFGLGSEHTISRCIHELIAHGLIYRTRMGGYQQGASLYAVTWLPISKQDGLFLAGFKPCAWRDWMVDEKKSPPSKMQSSSCKKGKPTPVAAALLAGSSTVKNADTELMPVGTAGGAVVAREGGQEKLGLPPPMSPISRLLKLNYRLPPLRLVA